MRPISRTLVSVLSLPLLAAVMVAQSAPPAADTYTRSSFPTTNYGTSTTLQVRNGYNSYIQFNLAPIPTGTTVAKATLRLYVDAVNTAGSFNLLPVSGAWTESGLNWNGNPAVGTSLGSTAVTSANQFILIDVTSLVQGWLTTPSSNYGVSLQLVGTTGQFDFDSKEAEGSGGGGGGGINTSHEPELLIALNGPAGPAGAPGAPGAAGADGAPGAAGAPGPPGPGVSGTTNTIPLFATSSSLGDSPIKVSGGNIGIGLTNTSTFDDLMVLSPLGGGGVGASGRVDPAQSNYGFSDFSTYIYNPNATTPNLYVWSIGSEGVYNDNGTTSNLDFYIFDPRTNAYNLGVDGSDNVYLGANGYPYGGAPALFAGVNGNVGIGTVTPAKKLEVNGDAQVDGKLFGPGGGAVVLGGADYAEAVNVKGSSKNYEPGDVLVIGTDGLGEIQKSSEPYSTMVSGIYATRPGLMGSRESLDKKAAQIPMGMVGIVPTKVTTESGPIHKGDLLVSSSTPGFAMKGTDRNRMLGAVIGKAMGDLESGSGVVEVLVTLQ